MIGGKNYCVYSGKNYCVYSGFYLTQFLNRTLFFIGVVLPSKGKVRFLRYLLAFRTLFRYTERRSHDWGGLGRWAG